MKNKKFFFISFLFFLGFSQIVADERKNELDKLFKELKKDNSTLAFEIEQKIWKIWSTHPKKNQLTVMLNKGSELVKYQPKFNFTFGKFLSYIIVSIITFIAIIIVLDTFKDPLSNIFPNLELVLYNLFETLRDLILFAKDLN